MRSGIGRAVLEGAGCCGFDSREIHMDKAKSKLKITYLTETESGCFKYRVQIPAKYLERRGHTVRIIDHYEEFAKYPLPDVVVLTRLAPTTGDGIREFVELAKKARMKLVYEVDDAIDIIPPHNPFKSDLATIQRAMELQAAAQVVTTTTVNLAKHLAKNSTGQVAVLPNSMDLEDWTLRRFGNKKLRIGWAGSASHFRDLAIVLDVVRDLQKEYDFEFVVQGICDDPTLDAFYAKNRERLGRAFETHPLGVAIKTLVDKLNRLPHYEFHPYVKVEEYPAKLTDMNLDIGLCPLEVDSFNNKKSCLKFYEYAMTGTVALASKALPYSEEMGLTAKNNYRDWREKLELLIRHFHEGNNETELYKPQRDWVVANRNAAENVPLWEKAYML